MQTTSVSFGDSLWRVRGTSRTAREPPQTSFSDLTCGFVPWS